MVQYKNQHYIPEFYLKAFSKDELSINIYNLKSKTLLRKGLRKTCSESYFYAKADDFEKCVSPLEGKFKYVLDKVIREKNLKNLTAEEYIFILYFIGFQHTRTNKAKKKSKEFFDLAYKFQLKELLSYAPKLARDIGLTKEFLDELQEYEIETTGAYDQSISHMYTMLLGLTSTFLTYDLKPLLIINETEEDFIISDDPIVFYNSYYNDKRETGITGFASNGLQIFCPLDLKTLLILYDEKFYDFNCGVIKVCAKEDIDAINSLQFFSCDDLIFFADNYKYILDLNIKLEGQMNAERKKDNFVWIACRSSFGLPTFHGKLTRNNINYNLKLSFMNVKTKVKTDGYCRNTESEREHRRIIASMEKEYTMLRDH